MGILPKGKGTIGIILDNTVFYPGQTIRGKIQLNLDEPVEARALRVDFYGLTNSDQARYEKRLRKLGVAKKPMNLDPLTGAGGQPVSIISKKVSGKRVYKDKEEFDFELKIPADALHKLPGGLMGAIYERFVDDPYVFQLDVSLDIAFKLDINARKEIKVVRSVAEIQKTP